MADAQIATLNQQINDYNTRYQYEKSRYDEISKKVIAIHQECQTLEKMRGQGATVENELDVEKKENDLKEKMIVDFTELNQYYLTLEYERFKRDIGEINDPSELRTLLNTAASFLIQYNEPMPKLIAQRESIIDQCIKLQGEIEAINKEIQPVRQQAADEIIESRKETLDIHNKINYLKIDRVNKELKHFLNRYQSEVEISKLEGHIASSQTTYATQRAALSGLQYVSMILKSGQKFTPEQVDQIKGHTSNINKILTDNFKDKSAYEKELKRINEAVSKLNESRKAAANRINDILLGFSKVAQIEYKTTVEINKYKTKSNMTELDNRGKTMDTKRKTSQNQSLDAEIDEYKAEFDKISEENSRIKEAIENSEKFRNKTKDDMDKIQKDLENKLEKKAKCQLEDKAAKDDYKKCANDFLSILADLSKVNNDPEIKKVNDQLSSQIKNISTKINEISLFNDVEVPYNNFILSQTDEELESIKKSRAENSKITNVQFYYDCQPNNMFSITRAPFVPFYIVKEAHVKLALDAVFYPNNIDPMYPTALIVANLLYKYNDIQSLFTSAVSLIENTIKSDATNIDPNTQGMHSPSDMVKSYDKKKPFVFGKLLPGKSVTLEDAINRGLSILIFYAMVRPVTDKEKKDVVNLLKAVDEKTNNSNENSTVLKKMLNLIQDPKARKKKQTVTKMPDDEVSMNMFVGSACKIDDKDRKQDVPINKKSMSVKEKDLDMISLVEEKALSDKDFYDLFTYVIFNAYQKLTADDLILAYRQKSPSRTDFFNYVNRLQQSLEKFIKAQLQIKRSKSAKGNDELMAFKRWIRIAEIAENDHNLFLLQAIIDALKEAKDIKEAQNLLHDDKKELDIYNKIINYLVEGGTAANELLADIKKTYGSDKSKSWFYIPSFRGPFSSPLKLKTILDDKDLPKDLSNDILNMRAMREISDQIYFTLSGINSEVHYNLNIDVVRGLEKKVAPPDNS